LDQAEVRLPYGELKSLLTQVTRPAEKPEPDPALLSARFKLSIVAGKLVVDATFRTATFADGLARIPLVGGNVMVESQKPADARVVIQDKMLCQVLEKAGAQVLDLRLMPTFGTDGANLTIPACPATIFETSDLGDARSLAL
jgi:hypothetical protein